MIKRLSIVFFLLFNMNVFALDSFAQTDKSKAPSATDFIEPITPEEDSPLEKNIINQKKYADIPNFISLYKINYFKFY